MSIVVMRKKFDAVPATTDIMQLLFGVDSGDRDKAKDALQAFLAPVKDLLDLLYLVDQMKNTAERHVELLKEQEALIATVAGIKAQADTAKAAFVTTAKEQQAATVKLSDQVKALESQKAKIETEISAKLRINKTVSDEYDRLRGEMLAKVAVEEKAARKGLESIEAQVAKAQTDLDSAVTSKKQLLASLSG